MRVIGTAGHIDHGKSSLVERLTGIDPDRLPEEKRRGMTIDLGFAWMRLPSGTEVSIIDVPGHERFVRTMLAGIGGIDVALLVIAADDGVMPQTREHMNILDLLGVRHGVVALTKVDLVDSEIVELAISDALGILAGTALEGIPIVPMSSVTGQGLEQLVSALERAVDSAPELPKIGVPFLPVDRVFTVEGFGTVVTGTLQGGVLEIGQDVEVLPAAGRRRIRSLQTHHHSVERAEAGSRVAVNLAPATREGLTRGSMLAAPGTAAPVSLFDASLRVLDDVPFPLRSGMTVQLHVGSAERSAVIRILDSDHLLPGARGWVQLRCDPAVPAVRGLPFIVRLPAPARTVAGGQIVDLSPRRRYLDSAGLIRLQAMNSGDSARMLLGILSDDKPRTVPQLAISSTLPAEEIEALLRTAHAAGEVVVRGTLFQSAKGWVDLRRRAEVELDELYRDNPLRRGVPREEFRRRLRASPEGWTATVDLLLATGIVREAGPLLAGSRWSSGLDGHRGEAERVALCLRKNQYSPPSEADLLRDAGTSRPVLTAMVEDGTLVRIAPGCYFAREVYLGMVAMTLHSIQSDGEITVASLRDQLGTSRRIVLAFLEHLDAERITRRDGDRRVLGSRAFRCA